MKKLMLLALGLMALGIAASSFAADNLSFNISITVRLNAVDISTNAAANNGNWGVMTANTTHFTTQVDTAWIPIYQVYNSGGVAIDLNLQQTGVPTGWTALETGIPGDARTGGQYRLFGVLTGYETVVAQADFDNGDIIPATAPKKADGAVGGIFARPGEGGTDQYSGGWNIVPETGSAPDQYKGTRALKLCIDTPATPPSEDPQTLTVYLLATAH